MRAPFPFFGGKSRVADTAWRALGDVANYVEPFCGSAAVLLARPDWHRGYVETVNDADCYVANFWRALSQAPAEVARWADWPVNEADLHARHRWLLGDATAEWRERMHSDPEHCDPQIAGWWVWGISQWIGSGWCVTDSRKLPHLGNPGRGVHRQGPARQLPHLGNSGMGVHRQGQVAELIAIGQRLRRVRVACGDWRRVLTPSVLWCSGSTGATGVFLDPPYGAKDQQGAAVYGVQAGSVAVDVAAWAREHGADPCLRIILCGYEGEHDMPDDWQRIAWKASGGYESQRSEAREVCNASRERLWLSPHCQRLADDSAAVQGALVLG